MYVLKRKDGKGYSVIKSLETTFQLLETRNYLVASLDNERFIDRLEFYKEIVDKYKEELQ